MKPTWTPVTVILITSLALLLRLPHLDRRPMHGDEAVHAVKCDTLWERGAYVYNPNEYHGPTLYYLTLPVLWLSGAKDFGNTTETTFRIVPALFGAGVVVLLFFLSDAFGRVATVAAAAMMALSPAMVFYSRHYIQETLLAFFTLAVIAAGWRLICTRRVRWALLTGLFIGCMHATKETSVIALGCMATALVLTWLGQNPRRKSWAGASRNCDRESSESQAGQRIEQTDPEAARTPHLREGFGLADADPHPGCKLWVTAAAIVIFAVMTSVTLYSVFFTHGSGPLDSLRAYAVYFHRAAGQGWHDHPWHYYFATLLYTHYAGGPVWSEALILVFAIIGVVSIWKRALSGPRSRAAPVTQGVALGCLSAPRWGYSIPSGHSAFARFLSIYTILITIAYSAIPYKTPWCLVQMLLPMTMFAGVGFAALASGPNRLPQVPRTWATRLASARFAVIVVFGIGLFHLGWQAYLANFRYESDPRNPYVYAHPVSDVVRLGQWVDTLATVHPDGRRMLVKVIAVNPWPLPWYLRRLERVGYWEEPPADVDAAVVIVAADVDANLGERFEQEYQVTHYGLRRDSVLAVYVERSLWQSFKNRMSAGGKP